MSASSNGQSVVARLRNERDYWRDLALNQESKLQKANDLLGKMSESNRQLEGTAKRWKGLAQFAHNNSSDCVTKLNVAVSAYEKVHNELDATKKAMTELRKSDRTKGQLAQRNLALKAAFRSVKEYANLVSNSTQDPMTDTLLEALSAATERVDELENAGGKLLNVLDRDIDSDVSENGSIVSDDSDAGDNGYGPGENLRYGTIVDAKARLRKVLEDGTFQEGKELWGFVLLDGQEEAQ